MKSRDLRKKLILNKKTVAHLNNVAMRVIHGGIEDERPKSVIFVICPTDTCTCGGTPQSNPCCPTD